MRRARWAWLAAALAIAVVVASWVLGIYSLVNLAGPWLSPKSQIDAIRKSTPRIYVTDDRNSLLYGYCQTAVTDMREGKLSDARSVIEKGSKIDPKNPLFDYLKARAAFVDNDLDTAMKCIKNGNNKDTFLIYSSNRIRPDKWNRLEVGEVSHLVRQLVKVKTDLKSLVALYDVGQKIIFCQPADYSVVSYGLFIRRFVATKIILADKGRLTPEARRFFQEVSQYSGPAWTLYDDSGRYNVTDARSRLYMAMRMRRSGTMSDFIEAYILAKDLEAQSTSEYVVKRVKIRPANVFQTP